MVDDALVKIKSFFSAQQITVGRKRLLLAVSGGVDSMVLFHLIHTLGFDYGVAHCNFQLRGAESDGDEHLVRTVASDRQAPFFHISFDTTSYAQSRKVSIQVAARELRYQWLEQIRRQYAYDYILTAHHLSDNMETVLMHFIRGTGVKGLRGMSARQGRLIRPILHIPKSDITAYSATHSIDFRDDSSNASDKYLRNKIRHQLMPLIIDINPGFEAGFQDRISVFADLESVYDGTMARQHRQLFEHRGADVYIPIARLRQTVGMRSVLYEFLASHGFNSDQVDDILAALDAEPGRQFISPTARLIKDRRFLILTRPHTAGTTALAITTQDSEITLPHAKILISSSTPSAVEIKKDKKYAYLNADKLEFPLMLRLWRQGDYFYPFGMGMKKKKISKYFKDQKIPIHEKEQIWILESNQKIVWIAGERIDERYKIDDSTTSVLVLQWIPGT